MTLREFHNGLRVLLNIDAYEFMPAVYPQGTDDQGAAFADWEAFRDNPHRWFIQAPDAKAQAIWKIVEGRLSPA